MSQVGNRFGQLTYTSFDAGGLGGWQVKDRAGLSDGDVDVLRARIDPRLESGTELPRFPAPDEVDRLPRRLVFAPERLPSGRVVVWWHHAPAGVDGSGRPGNVFTHVLADRVPLQEQRGPLGGQPVDLASPPGARWPRPIDLWRSPRWLAPYGAEAVRDCRLTGDVPEPGSAVDAEAVADFLLDIHHYRLGVLSVLLDAVAAAFTGGPRVVLATSTTDSAAMWIGAVSHLMAGVTAARFGFSTLERPRTVVSRFSHGVHLACVPAVDHTDMMELPDRRFVLLAEDEAVELGDLDGQPHSTQAGDRVSVTEWSVLARVVLMDHHTAQRALNGLDSLADQARAHDEPDGLTGEPSWPLAMVISTQLDVFKDAAQEAARVLVRRSPRGLSGASRLRSSVRETVEATQGATAGELWQSLHKIAIAGKPLSETGEELLGVYVRRAVHDAEWLGQRGGAPLPAGRWSTRWAEAPEVYADVEAALQRWETTSARDVRAARALVGLTDLLFRLGLAEPYRDRLQDALDRGVARALTASPGAPPLGVSGSELVALLPGIGEPAAALLREVVNGVLREARHHGGGQIVLRVAGEVVRWLYPQVPAPVLPEPGAPVEDFPLRAELAYHLVRADPYRFPRERPLALMARWPDGVDGAEVGLLVRGPAWTVDELDRVERSFPGALPLTVFGPAAKSEPLGGAFEQVVEELGRRRRLSGSYGEDLGETPTPAHLLRLRRLTAQEWWRGQQWFRHDLLDVLRGGLWAEQLGEVPYDDEVADVVRAACVVAAASKIGQSEAEHLVAGSLGTTTLSRRGWSIVSEALPTNVALPEVCAVAVLSEPRFPVPEVVTPLQRWVGGIGMPWSGDQSPVLQQCARAEIGRSGVDAEWLARAVWAVLAESLAGDQSERTQRVVQRFLQSWLRHVAPRSGMFQRLWGDR